MSSFTFDFKKDKSVSNIINSLDINGFAKIQNLFISRKIEILNNEVYKSMQNPSVCGSFGYAKKDHFRKYIFPPLIMGSPLTEVILNKFLIKIIESYFRSEPII